MTVRADIERAISEEEQVLAQVARLLEDRVVLAGWPEDLQTAFGLALADPTMPRAEGWKAVTLRRHLFGPAEYEPDLLRVSRAPSAVDRKCAERLRAGLPAVVRYRAGGYLLAPRSPRATD